MPARQTRYSMRKVGSPYLHSPFREYKGVNFEIICTVALIPPRREVGQNGVVDANAAGDDGLYT